MTEMTVDEDIYNMYIHSRRRKKYNLKQPTQNDNNLKQMFLIYMMETLTKYFNLIKSRITRKYSFFNCLIFNGVLNLEIKILKEHAHASRPSPSGKLFGVSTIIQSQQSIFSYR